MYMTDKQLTSFKILERRYENIRNVLAGLDRICLTTEQVVSMVTMLNRELSNANMVMVETPIPDPKNENDRRWHILSGTSKTCVVIINALWFDPIKNMEGQKWI